MDTISIRKITKKNNSTKNVGGVTVFNLMLYISSKICEIILNGIKIYREDKISILKITNGNNSAKNVGGMTFFNLCTSFGHALYFYQVL